MNDGSDVDAGWMSKNDDEVGRGAPSAEVEYKRDGRAQWRTFVHQMEVSLS